MLPDRIHIRPIKITRPIPTPTPDYSISSSGHTIVPLLHCLKGLTIFRSRLERHFVVFLFREKPVVRAIPAPILRVRARVVGQAADALVAPDSSEVAPFRMDDIVDFLQGCERSIT